MKKDIQYTNDLIKKVKNIHGYENLKTMCGYELGSELYKLIDAVDVLVKGVTRKHNQIEYVIGELEQLQMEHSNSPQLQDILITLINELDV